MVLSQAITEARLQLAGSRAVQAGRRDALVCFDTLRERAQDFLLSGGPLAQQSLDQWCANFARTTFLSPSGAMLPLVSAEELYVALLLKRCCGEAHFSRRQFRWMLSSDASVTAGLLFCESDDAVCMLT